MTDKKITIIGLGLIGGSLAKALHQYAPDIRLIAVDRDEDALAKAKSLGVIADFSTDISQGVEDSDCVVIATPVKTFSQILPALKTAYEQKPFFFTDVASIKQSIILEVEKAFGEIPNGFVPGHPIAGKEHAGFDAASSDLFVNHPVILTPTEYTTEAAMLFVQNIWSQVKAKLVVMSADHHDEVLGGTSHVPHILSYALMAVLADSDLKEEIFEFAAGGLRDFSRIAASDPELWADICLQNKEQIKKYLAELDGVIGNIQSFLHQDNKSELQAIFSKAKHARTHFEQILAKRQPK